MTSYSSHAEEEEVEEETSHLYHSSLYPLDVYAGGGPHSAAPSGMEQFSSFTAQCKGDDEHFVLGVTEHEQRQLLKRHPPTRNDLQHRDFESQVHRGCATTAPNIHIQVPRMDLNPATIKNQALASSPQSRESPTDYVPHMNNAHQINYLSSQEHDLRKQINVPKHKYNRNQGFNSFNDAIAYNVPRTNSVASTGIKLSTFPDFVSLADTIHTPVAIKDENLFSHSHAESAGSTKNATKRSAANFSFPDQTAVSEGHSASKMTGQTEETLLHNNSSKLLVTAEMSHSAYRDTDMLINSQCNGYGTMMPSESCQLSFFEGQREQKSHPHRRNDDNFSVSPLSQNNLPELQCEESLVKEPSPRLSPIFHCPECAQDFQYNTPKTAAALFAIHRRGCGQTTKDASKRMKSGDEGGNRLRGKRIVQRTYVDERQQRGTKRRHGRHNSSFSIGVSRTPRNVIKRHYSPVATVVPAPRINKKKNKIQIQTQTTATTLAIDAPQKYKNAFDFFNTSRLTISKGHSAKQGEIKSQWKSMTIEERKPFVLMARRDRDRYNREMQVVDNKNIEQRSNLQSDPTEGTNEEIPVGKSVNVSKSKSEISPSGEKYVTVSKFKSCRMETSSDSITAQSSYPYAPLGHLWLEKSLKSSMYLNCEADMGRSNASGNSLFGRRWVWDEGYFVDGHLNPRADKNYRKGCTCGSNHLFSILNTIQKHSPSNAAISIGKTRRSDRSAYSSSVTSQLADGQLDPHTLIICDDYELGPEYRFMKDPQTESVQPFSVRVNPDVTFIADLHSHLSRMEIIGLLGGYYSKEEKCIYIQAAFPCKSTDRTDSGLTDVEMDPVCQIYAIDAIANHGMTAVGWYHSHPDFQPIPSITDIDNQANYQQLFQGGDLVGMIAEVSPFVGLIVGTYDGKNPTSQSEMRYVRSRGQIPLTLLIIQSNKSLFLQVVSRTIKRIDWCCQDR
jgi:proteasome lid subunit RPN8/RPN11